MKRGFDILVAGTLLVILLPVFLVLVLLVRTRLGSPVLFRQQRPGLHGRPFEIIKFRTLTDARDSEGRLLPDGERLTRFGRFLRSSSLDELPELWYVLKGGVFVAPDAIINTGSRIADAVIVNAGVRIDHDCEIGPATHIAPGATLSGSVTVGRNSWVGTGVSIRQRVRIGDHVTIGVGAAVVSGILAAGTYVGVPARASARRNEG